MTVMIVIKKRKTWLMRRESKRDNKLRREGKLLQNNKIQQLLCLKRN